MSDKKHDSDSSEQLKIENAIRDILRIKYSDITSWPFKPEQYPGLSFQIDGYSESTNSYFEFYAGLDKLKSGQHRKVACDILKLITIEEILKEQPYSKKSISKYFVVINDKIENRITSNSWLAHSLKRFNVKIFNLEKELGPKAIEPIKAAKKLQGDAFRNKSNIK